MKINLTRILNERSRQEKKLKEEREEELRDHYYSDNRYDNYYAGQVSKHIEDE